MTDLYTNGLLTVIAVVLVAIAVGGFDVVGSANADGHKVHKLAISGWKQMCRGSRSWIGQSPNH